MRLAFTVMLLGLAAIYLIPLPLTVPPPPRVYYFDDEGYNHSFSHLYEPCSLACEEMCSHD
jgi:hypothetical protein